MFGGLSSGTTELEKPVKGDIHYRNYTIRYDPPPIPIRTMDWQFWHYDYGGPEDGRCGSGNSEQDCIAQIDEMEEEEKVARYL